MQGRRRLFVLRVGELLTWIHNLGGLGWRCLRHLLRPMLSWLTLCVTIRCPLWPMLLLMCPEQQLLPSCPRPMALTKDFPLKVGYHCFYNPDTPTDKSWQSLILHTLTYQQVKVSCHWKIKVGGCCVFYTAWPYPKYHQSLWDFCGACWLWTVLLHMRLSWYRTKHVSTYFIFTWTKS